MTSNVEATAGPPGLTLLGGPLHQLGRRLGLVRDPSDTLRLGLAIGVFLWIVLVGLAAVEGRADQTFSLRLVGAHVRLLLAVPLLFLAEALLDPRFATFVHTLVRSGTVPASVRPRLDSEIRRVRGWAGSWFIDVVCLLVAIAALLLQPGTLLPAATASLDPAQLGETTLAGMWYRAVCLTAFRFVLLRWLARLALWTWFLFRVARLDLAIAPSHPDRAGGLGYLEIVHMHFLPLVFAFSAVEAASFAEGIASGTLAFEATYPIFAVALGLDALLFLGPLLIFAPMLWEARVRGLSDYSVLASDYVSGFDRKWLERNPAPEEPLLGTADLQSLADLGNSSNVVREMRVVPASFELVRNYAIMAFLPMVPLLLLKYPVAELAKLFVSRLTGL